MRGLIGAVLFQPVKDIPAAGHVEGEQFSVQANMMRNDKVWPAMAAATPNAAHVGLAALEAIWELAHQRQNQNHKRKAA